MNWNWADGNPRCSNWKTTLCWPLELGSPVFSDELKSLVQMLFRTAGSHLLTNNILAYYLKPRSASSTSQLQATGCGRCRTTGTRPLSKECTKSWRRKGISHFNRNQIHTSSHCKRPHCWNKLRSPLYLCTCYSHQLHLITKVGSFRWNPPERRKLFHSRVRFVSRFVVTRDVTHFGRNPENLSFR